MDISESMTLDGTPIERMSAIRMGRLSLSINQRGRRNIAMIRPWHLRGRGVIRVNSEPRFDSPFGFR